MPEALIYVNAAILITLLLKLVRPSGLRYFSKMSAHDFVVMVATGTIVAATMLQLQMRWWMGVIVLAALATTARCKRTYRARSSFWITGLCPRGPVPYDPGVMRGASVSDDDLCQTLRRAGLASLSKVGFFVLQTTGDVLVMNRPLDATWGCHLRGRR